MQSVRHSYRMGCIILVCTTVLASGCEWPKTWLGRSETTAALATDAETAIAQHRQQTATPESTSPAPTSPAPTSPAPATPSSGTVEKNQAPSGFQKPGSGRFLNPPAKRRQAKRLPDGDLVLNFANADLRDVVQAILGETLEVAYVIDPSVGGTVDLESLHPLPADAALSVLETVLFSNGAALLADADVYRIVPLADVQRYPAAVVGRSGARLPAGYAVRVIPLRYASADAMLALLQQVTARTDVAVSDSARNLIMVSGTSRELSNLIELVTLFDADWLAGLSTALVPLSEADAATVAGEIESLFRTKTDGPLQGILQIIVIERLNALLIASPRQHYVREASAWIERLDRGVAAGRNLYVIELENAEAKNLAELLNDLFTTDPDPIANTLIVPTAAPATLRRPTASSRNPEPSPRAKPDADAGQSGSQPFPSVILNSEAEQSGSLAGAVKIIADEQKNALVVLALPQDYRMIAAAVRRLDTPPLQVLIEATIVEVTLQDALRYGVQWFFKSGGLGIADSSVGVLSLGTTQTLSPTFPGFSLIVNGADGVRAILDALDTVTTLNVISSPHLIVRDNGTAVLKVGAEVPVATQQRQSNDTPNAPLVSTIRFRDTGVILSVTPQVNASGQINLQIEQEVSSVSDTVDSGVLTPTITQRQIKSAVAVQSGDSVVLGGLISERKTNSSQGLPFLARIPVFGALFGQQNNQTDRTELVVLISPRIIRDSAEAKSITAEIRDKLKGLKGLDASVIRPAVKPPR